MKESPPNQSLQRRDFLKTTTVVAGITLIPGIILHRFSQAKSPDQPVTAAQRWGMLVDTHQCRSDCQECVTACKTEHGIAEQVRPEIASQWIRKVEVRNRQTGKEYSLPLFCQHCEHPPCADVCPTGASFKRADGIVLVDKHICIGCRYCMMACPYKARSLVHEPLTDQKSHSPRGKGTVEACTLCVHRVDQGKPPACVEACQRSGHQALLFGDLADPTTEISRKLADIHSSVLRPDLQLNPGVRYQGI